MRKYESKKTPVAAKYNPCHTDGTLVFEKDGVSFYAGKFSHVSSRSYDLIIDLSGSVTQKVRALGLRGKVAEFANDLAAQILGVSWPDYGVIKWDRGLFEQLLEAIKNDKLETVYVCCVGGHGRTGTMISILAGLSGVIPKDECPVEWLRKKYCENVVESQEQLDYVAAITGLKVSASPGKAYSTYTQVNAGWPPVGGGWQGNVYGGSRDYPVINKSFDGEYWEPKEGL